MIDALARRLGPWPAAGTLIALIVALTLWRSNMLRLGYEHVLPTIAAVAVIALLATLLLRLAMRGWARAGLASGLLAAFLLYAPALARPFGEGAVSAAVLLLLAAAGLFLARRIPEEAEAAPLNGRLNLLLLLVASFVAAGAAAAQWRLERNRPAPSSAFAPLQRGAGSGSPDVWHILFDRYASEGTLRERYAFDNRPFLDALRARGFGVADGAYSNYQRTAHSVAATMNGAELDRLAAAAARGPQNDWVPIYRAIADNRSTRFFADQGYRTVFAGSWWSPTRTSEAGEVISYRSLPELARVLLDRSVPGMALKALRLPYGDGREEQCRRANHKFDRLEALASEDGRKHVFAHFLVPHPPFVLNPDGSCRSLDEARRSSRRDNYVAQVEFVNRRVLRLVDSILAAGRPAVIVIHSDEGPWPEPHVGDEHGLGTDPVPVDWAKLDGARLREKMGILFAVRSPGGPPRVMPDSPVSIYPAIAREYFGGPPPAPGRHRVFVADDALYRFEDVSARLR